MDAPIWSNDLLYLGQMIITISITVALTAGCFYLSKRADRRRALRLARSGNPEPAVRPRQPIAPQRRAP